MEKFVLACDLDNTLIHSSKYRAPGDICVEWIDGREQAYMAKEAFHLLGTLWERICFVPVTTRSTEQYRRVQWPDGRIPPLAVAANGGVCLRGGVPDAAWAGRTAEAVGPYLPELLELREELVRAGGFSRCRMVDESYLYVHYLTVGPAVRCAERYQGRTAAEVCRSGRKVYFFPPGIDKGSALRQLRALTAADKIICAGDSEIDVPMLAEADLAFVPTEALSQLLPGRKYRVCPADRPFSEFVLSSVRELAASPPDVCHTCE